MIGKSFRPQVTARLSMFSMLSFEVQKFRFREVNFIVFSFLLRIVLLLSYFRILRPAEGHYPFLLCFLGAVWSCGSYSSVSNK